MTHYIPPQNPNQAQVQQIKAEKDQQQLWRKQQEVEAKKRKAELDRKLAAEMASRANKASQKK